MVDLDLAPTAFSGASAGRPAPNPAPNRAAPRRRLNAGVGFVLPFLGLFVLTMIAPIVYAIIESTLTLERSGLAFGAPTAHFAGVANYVRALTDPGFLASIGHVLLIGIVQVPLMLALALVLALLLDARATPFKKFFRIAIFVPYGMPGVIAGLMWSFLYAPGLSPINSVLKDVGLNLDFTASAALPWSISNVMTWAWTGYNMIILFAALQAVPEDTLEAAALDGCTEWRSALAIKIPLIRPALILTAVFSIIGTIQLYNEPATLRAVAANLGNDYTPVMNSLQSLANNDYNYAAAQSVIIAVIIFGASVIFFRVIRRNGDAS